MPKSFSWKEYCLIISLYIILTILLTYPLIFNLTTHIPSDEGTNFRDTHPLIAAYGEKFSPLAEPYYILWYLWHFKYVLIDLHENPFLAKDIFYPVGENLVFNTIGYYPLLLGTLTQLLGANLILSYNLQILTSFILAAFFMYLLAKYLTKNKLAAFASGIFYSFSAYHYVRAINGHLDFQAIQFLPLFLLFLIKWHQERKTKYAIFTGLLLTINSLVIWYYGLYLILFLALYLVYHYLLKKTITPINWKQLFFLFFTFFITVLPFTLPLFHEMSTYPEPYWQGNGISYQNSSADPLSYFIPNVQHTLLAPYLISIYHTIVTDTEIETVTFLSYTLIILTLFALRYWKKEKQIPFLFMTAVGFFLLSLGPTLHIFRTFYSLPLPYFFLTKLPFFNALAEPGRFSIIVLLSTTLLAAYGSTFLLHSIKKRSGKALLTILLILFFTLETIIAPIRMISPEIPPFYTQLKNDPTQYSILELPLTPLQLYPSRLYYQTYHHKNLINGIGGRIRDETKISILGNPLTHIFEDSTEPLTAYRGKSDILIQNLTSIGTSVLSYYNIRWIILHKNWFGNYDPEAKRWWIPNSALERTRQQQIENILHTSDPTYEDNQVIAYTVRNRDITAPFLTLGKGWYDRELWHNGTPSRWIRDTATLNLIVANTQKPHHLTFRTTNFGTPKTLTILINNEIISVNTINGWTTITLPVPPLQAGTHEIEFNVREPCQIPQDTINTPDQRCLTLTFENIMLL